MKGAHRKLKQEEWKSARDHGGRRWATMGGITREKGEATERNYRFQGFPHMQSRGLDHTIENLHPVTIFF